MIRRLARPMLATVFVIDGVETLRNPQAHVADAAPLVDKATPLVEKGEQAVNEAVSASVPNDRIWASGGSAGGDGDGGPGPVALWADIQSLSNRHRVRSPQHTPPVTVRRRVAPDRDRRRPHRVRTRFDHALPPIQEER